MRMARSARSGDRSSSAIWVISRFWPKNTRCSPRSNGRSPGTVICRSASPIRRRRRSGSAVTVGARVPPPGIVQMACRKWIGKFKSCRGHYLTSADATPCKIHATRAIGVAPNDRSHPMPETHWRDIAQRLTDEQVSTLEVIEARGQTAARLAWPHRGRPVSGDPVDRLMTPN